MNRKIIHIVSSLLLLLFAFRVSVAQNSYIVNRLPFNSRIYDDLAPVILNDGLLFCSDRKTSVFVDYKALDNSRPLNFYLVKKKDSLKWSAPHLFVKELRTVFNEGPASFNEATHTLFFTRDISIDKKNKTAPNNSGIFYVVQNGNSWGAVQAFPYNDPAFKTGHPSVSKDGKTLYFASDRPGGYGKSDIYVSHLVNGQWSKPENLGKNVNSPNSELYPFILSAERLYFSSDRPGSLGGLDLYYSRSMDGKWMLPIHLNTPFNSTADDYSFTSDPSLSSGYFSSNRDRSDNIYSFSSQIPSMVGCSEQVENNYCYLFFEKGEMNLDTLPYIYEWNLGDSTYLRGLKVQHCFEEPGTYLVALNVFDTLVGVIKKNVATYQVAVEPEVQVYISSPDTVFSGEPVQFDASDSYLPGTQIADYFWNFDDGNISKTATPENIFQTPGIYHVHLLVKSTVNTLGKQQEFCNYKNIVVINR